MILRQAIGRRQRFNFRRQADARPLDELRPTIDSLVARRILDRLLAAAGMHVSDSPADDAALRVIGARLRAEGHERGAVRPVLDSIGTSEP